MLTLVIKRQKRRKRKSNDGHGREVDEKTKRKNNVNLGKNYC